MPYWHPIGPQQVCPVGRLVACAGVTVKGKQPLRIASKPCFEQRLASNHHHVTSEAEGVSVSNGCPIRFPALDVFDGQRHKGRGIGHCAKTDHCSIQRRPLQHLAGPGDERERDVCWARWLNIRTADGWIRCRKRPIIETICWV